MGILQDKIAQEAAKILQPIIIEQIKSAQKENQEIIMAKLTELDKLVDNLIEEKLNARESRHAYN